MTEPAAPDPDHRTASRGATADTQQGFWRAAIIVGKIALAIAIIGIAFTAAHFGYDYLKSAGSAKSRTAAEWSKISPAAVQEWRLATADHEIIAAAVAACSKIFDLGAQPDFVRAELRLDTLPDGRRSSASDQQQKGGNLVLSNYQRAAVYLSDSITRGRIESATNANENYSNMFWFQIAIVSIGAITTILISIKSIAPADNAPTAVSLSLWVGILAIIFSSVGTATSALNSFYGPRESYLKNERSLASLRQLHSDIAVKITSVTDAEHPDKCPKLDPAKKDDPYSKQVQDWTSKLGAILNAADSGSSSSQSTGNTTDLPAPKTPP
ncbi:MAG TPA: hypothetical protein VN926_07995 [Bradyrhizobium sp.]|jgi:hypothetical protein|nr:hypothetical protein [Bradyrhizobium sp.]